MIQKLKNRFTFLAMLTLCSLFLLVVSGLILLNYASVLREADYYIDIVIGERQLAKEDPDAQDYSKKKYRHEEIPFEARYFLVYLDESEKEVIDVDTSQIYLVSEADARDFALWYMELHRDRGMTDWFRYRIIHDDPDGPYLIFLDCGRKIDEFVDYRRIAYIMSLVGLLVGYIFISRVSGRILKPVSESYVRQRQFVTDAGHEIKTPLTIISANLDLFEMDSSDSESLEDIRHQVERLRSLTNDLVLLSKMEESENMLEKIEFPVSDIVAEASRPFNAVAAQKGLTLNCMIEPMLTLNGNSKSIEQLTVLLLDNAIKYSAPEGEIRLKLLQDGKNILLYVSNPSATSISEEQVEHLFDRFYRSDASRNSETGGHGIGLSLANAIVAAHGGTLKAHYSEKGIFRILATFPT